MVFIAPRLQHRNTANLQQRRKIAPGCFDTIAMDWQTRTQSPACESPDALTFLPLILHTLPRRVVRDLCVLEVDPRSIAHKVSTSDQQDRNPFLFVGGTWDKTRKTIAEQESQDSRFLFYKEIFIENRALTDTTKYHRHMERIAAGTPRRGMRNAEELLTRLQGYVTLFREVERAGSLKLNRRITGRWDNEIGCAIDSHGKLVKISNGNNRFAIARFLDLPAMPVNILMMHRALVPDVVAASDGFVRKRLRNYLEQFGTLMPV
jgi:hypothetical protein